MKSIKIVAGKIVLIPRNNSIVVKNLEFRSKNIYSYLAESPSRPFKALVNAIDIGAAVLLRASAKIDNDSEKKAKKKRKHGT